jgi:hypothetical protein
VYSAEINVKRITSEPRSLRKAEPGGREEVARDITFIIMEGATVLGSESSHAPPAKMRRGGSGLFRGYAADGRNVAGF